MRKLRSMSRATLNTYLLGCSAIALATGWSSTAFADCAGSNPTVCSGTTVGKVTISSSGTVNVTNGATLSAAASDDAALNVTSTGSSSYTGYTYQPTYASVNVNGTISGNQYGILGNATGYNYAYPSLSLNMTVGATGQVLGQTAIYLDASGAGYHPVMASLDNSGLVQGGNIALGYNGNAGFSFVTNEAGGVIRGANGAIIAPVGTLTNAGLIDGGAGSAYALASSAVGSVYPSNLINTGTMTSSSTQGTIYLTYASPQITNSGTIQDTAGPAIYASNYLTMTNAAGGVIASPSGGNAIYAASGANIVNQGTITGSVFIGTSYNYDGSVLDTTKGTINGNVVFGGSKNTLMASWDVSANKIAGISGTVSGTTGTNTLLMDISQNLTLDDMFAHLAMPTNFQTLGIMVDSGVTATLNGDGPDGLQIVGSGNFVTTGQVTSAGAAFTTATNAPYNYSTQLGFSNTGSIRSVFSPPGGAVQYSDYAVSLNNVRSFINSGTITSVNGNGVYVYLNTNNWQMPATFSNSGSIIADGTALDLRTNSGVGVNSGTISSTRSVGLNAYSGTFNNTGSITGATTGAVVFSEALSNSGTITGTTTGLQANSANVSNSGTITATNGTGVNLGYSNLYNLAGGVITASGDAIEDTSGSTTVSNAGNINGNVNFALVPYYYSSGDTFVDNGGTVNGSVLFGGGANTYVTDFSTFVNGRFSNVTGVVDGGTTGVSTLVLRTGSDTTAKIAFATNFQKTEYDLSNSAKLTLSSDSTISKAVIFGGTGSVDLTADINTTNMPSLTVTTPYAAAGSPSTLSVISHGNLSFTATSNPNYYYSGAAVQLLNTSSFENAGTITAVSLNNYGPTATAISGGALVTNSGTITVDNATAITGAVKVVNTGSIAQAANGRAAYGLNGVNNVDNSGSIVTGNAAVTVNYYNNYYYYNGTQPLPTPSVTNSGVIHSTGADAIDLSYYYNPVSITNMVGGQIISDTAYAINSSAYTTNVYNYGMITGNIGLGSYGSNLIENHGTINGNVNLGTYYYASPSVFADMGGQLNGNLFFGGSNSTYITDISNYTGSGFSNVSGTISGTNLTLQLRIGTDTTAKVAFAPNFTNIGYLLSNNATLTLGSDSPLTKTLVLEGTGRVDLTADLNATDTVALTAGMANGVNSSDPSTLSIVSHGNMSLAQVYNYSSTGVQLSNTTRFENAGNITASGNFAAINGGDVVINSGMISLNNASAVLGATTVLNSGSIVQAVNGQNSYGLTDVHTVVNSGTIQTRGTAIILDNYYFYPYYYYTNYSYPNYYYPSAFGLTAPSVTNSGLIRSTNGDAIDMYFSMSGKGLTLNNTATGQIISDKAVAILSGNGDTDSIHNDGVIRGDIDLYSNNTLIENHGTITGTVNMMGYNSNTLRLTGGVINGTVNSAWGHNVLQLDVTDANAPTLALGTSAFNGFQELDMMAGVASMGGTYNFDTINVGGGRLIGLAGSSLTAQTITVAQGATFGSAGQVNGNITVNGILSPGASPGTMRVAGNVTLGSGSTSLFELTPTVNDKLLINGTLTINDGATLQLTGAPRLTPGQKLDLIDAAGGISGKFATIAGLPDTLYLTQSADGLQGMGLFSNSSAYSRQVSGVISTLNGALIDGKVSDALIAAFPALVKADTGQSDPVALTRLTPQAYASATQIAVKNAMTIVATARDQSHFATDTSGAFTFGGAVGNSGKVVGDPVSGIAGGKIVDNGVLSGGGYSTPSAWGAAFYAHLNGRERIGDLGAQTTTQSQIFGLQGQIRKAGWRFGAMSAYDWTDAGTRRMAPGGMEASGRYAMKTWMADVSLSYRARLIPNWSIEPRLEASYLSTQRDGVTEQGGGIFGLQVDGGTSKDSFVNGQLNFEGGQNANAKLHPLISVGLVSRIEKHAPMASALLNGLSVPLTAEGVAFDGTRATATVGLSYDVSRHMKASVSYNGEYGDNGSQRVNLGINWTF